MHCDEAPCVSVCQGKALVKTAEGPVIWKEENCIGCLSCINVCPFNTSLHYDPTQHKVFKCDMCYSRIQQGLKPACVEKCEDLGYNSRTAFGSFNDALNAGLKKANEIDGVLVYPDKTRILLLFTKKDFTEALYRMLGFGETYSTEAIVKANATKYFRIGWVPVVLGIGYYVLNWRKNRIEELMKIKEDKEPSKTGDD
jgi:Fe-S-cluster-containing dehydrogenase component